MTAYHRVLLKLSGEVFGGGKVGLDLDVINAIAREVAEVARTGVQVAIVVGGGNIFRGLSAAAQGMDRATADYMGMLATVINGLALQSALVQAGVETRVHFAGFQDSVYLCLAAMDLYVHPALMEGFGIAVLEAMAMGRPVVSTRQESATRPAAFFSRSRMSTRESSPSTRTSGGHPRTRIRRLKIVRCSIGGSSRVSPASSTRQTSCSAAMKRPTRPRPS